MAIAELYRPTVLLLTAFLYTLIYIDVGCSLWILPISFRVTSLALGEFSPRYQLSDSEEYGQMNDPW